MPVITLPDGAQRIFSEPVTAMLVAQSISPGLVRNALAARINGNLSDLATPIDVDAQFAVLTERDPDGLAVLRHSCAHLMAMAVKQLYPDAQVTIGPTVEDGFYYDFAYSRPFTPDDLGHIEQRMRELAFADIPVQRSEVSREAAIGLFESMGENYKCEIIRDLPEDATISLYRQGDFVDLCRGPHVPSTGRLKAFKLMKVAGAYWRGDSSNIMLQRIYGTCWADAKTLEDYLQRLEEAAKRDHRKLGAHLDLFHFDECAPGSVFWHSKGWTLFQQLITYMRQRQLDAGYEEVNTPDVMDRSLWEISGHWSNYRDHMFTTETEDGRTFALKPMNCPGSVSIFAHGLKSYRDLPIRMAEFGKVHRYEPSGALHGLMRVRHFTQDDAHIFCTLEQMQVECETVTRLILDIYRDFGFSDVAIKLSTRPINRIGSDEVWDRLERALSASLDAMGLGYTTNPGEGAFYGPKLEFVLRDAIGRDWQCGTLQVDLNLPERFDIGYINEAGERVRPVMLHRALFGSLERFIGILIEHHAGTFPAWLAPIQTVVFSITDAQTDYVHQVVDELKNAGVRAIADLRNEKVGFKVREHTLQRVPYLLVVGERERNQGGVNVRDVKGKDLGYIARERLSELFRARASTV
ncbi:threonine--tRNA ligase [Propionivibrio dicarboxylicus]|uniref:Threonine--tRNA ligase n=1 Tax=Propionivibrio dicarboxylicus TaxID=83767 RepID=A0A1G8F0D1_9RHOO|nr:threonine--tRNA ligase [Propionivibrio dicarboxylicus]SDH75598.1 threonyl-tRNA synthetase [Propionivibrio dicarboxylicus]